MKRSILDIARYSLLKPIYVTLFQSIILAVKIVSMLGISGAKVTTIKIGPMRLVAPEAGAKVIERAIDGFKSEDFALYERLALGPALTIIAGSDRNSFCYEFGYIVLSMAYFYSIEGLLSLLVLCVYLSQNSPASGISKAVAKKRLTKATMQTAVWLQEKGFPEPAIHWLKTNGIENNINPPRTSKKKFGGQP